MFEKYGNNFEVYFSLSALVAQDIFGVKVSSPQISLGSLQVNYFSSVFCIDLLSRSNRKGVFVKIPKRDVNRKTILPITAEDRRFAADEYQSLVNLANSWQSQDIGVSFVKPLKFINGYNAIVTERAYAGDLFKLIRQYDLLEKVGINGQNNPIPDILFRLGKALASFHHNFFKKKLFKVDEPHSKINNYCEQLRLLKVDKNILHNIINKIEGIKDYSSNSYTTNTLKGLDVRNILIDKNYRVLLLDPGKMKYDHHEMDLARFIVTCRIIYWGSILFFLRLAPNSSYEKIFLKGYYGTNVGSVKTLAILIIKELLKQWLMAYASLKLKSWPATIKHFLKFAYIDPFYKNQITSELSKL